VGFLYRLTYANGADAGEAEFPDSAIRAGDEIRASGTINGCVLLSVNPTELAGEFVDGAIYAVLEVEPA
jgi:hypothetical protein